MPNFSAWLSSHSPIVSASDRAVLAWRRINDKPTSIVVNRDGSVLPPQTVRLEYSEAERSSIGEAGVVSMIRKIIVFGVVNHPSVADTDLRYGDRFAFGGVVFHVQMVMPTLGEIQATAEAMT